MKKLEVKKIFDKLEEKYTKNSIIELNYMNNYTLLVSVLLSAQATDKEVNKATGKLFELVKSPEEMLKLKEENLKEYIKSINYFNTKARHIIQLSQMLVDKYKSEVPNTREDLENLPGVGRKTANVVLNIAFDKTSIAVDTHVFRVSNRIGLVKTKNVLDTEMELYKIVSKTHIRYVNHWLVLLGRYICKARKPDCSNCPINDVCRKIINKSV